MSAGEPDPRFGQACEWIMRLREESASPDIVIEWLAWCREDPSNGEAFELAREVWIAAGEIESVGAHADPQRTEGACVEASGRWQRSLRPLLALAAAAALTAIAFLAVPAWRWHFTPPRADVYATEAGENRVIRLPDGSTITLAGGSRLLTALDGRARSMLLDRGEAYFEVAHDPSRPFVVTAGGLHVTAVGTAFDVRTNSGRVVVAVASGVVDIDDNVQRDARPIAATRLSERTRLRAYAGKIVAVDSSGRLQVTKIDPAMASSWQEGRLAFVREPLSAVIESIVQHTGRKLLISDAAAGELRYTGTVFQSQLQDWLRGLPMVFPVTVEERANEVVIASRLPEL